MDALMLAKAELAAARKIATFNAMEKSGKLSAASAAALRDDAESELARLRSAFNRQGDLLAAGGGQAAPAPAPAPAASKPRK